MNTVDNALYSTLAAGTALITALGGTAIYWTVADQGASFPYCVFFQSTGRDENSSPRRARRLIYTVKGVTTDPDTAGDIDDGIDAALHDKALTITGWGNYWMMRENDIAYVEQTSAGVTVFHRGAQYGIRIAE